MHPQFRVGRSLYLWSALLALPGGLWIAFELYGLTLGGPQMLFFSIAHTMPPLLVAVLVAFPAGLAWLVQSVAALALGGYRSRIAVPRRALLVFVAAITTESVLLLRYESWSSHSTARVPLCLLGMATAVLAAREVWLWLRPLGTSKQPPGAVRDA